MGESGGRMAEKRWHAMRARLVQARAGPQADAADGLKTAAPTALRFPLDPG